MAHVYYILGLELTDQPLEKLENEVNAAIQTTFQQYSDYEMVLLWANRFILGLFGGFFKLSSFLGEAWRGGQSEL